MPSPVAAFKLIPFAKLLAAAEVALLVRQHVMRLEPDERRRVVQLVRKGHGRPSNLSDRERRELTQLVQKMEPREFANTATKRFTGMSWPGSGDRSGRKHR